MAPLAAFHSLYLHNYLIHCSRLLVHLCVISELHTCEEQRYITASNKDDKFFIKNNMQRGVFAGPHQKALTECGTVLSSSADL